MASVPDPMFEPRAMTAPAAAARPDDEIDLRDLLDLVVGGRWLLAAAVAATVLGAIGYLWVAAPVYKADALVQVETDKKTMNAALGEVAELLGGQTPVTAELEILKSRMVLGKVVDAMGLEIVAEPRYLPVIGRALARTGDAQRIEVGSLEVPDSLKGEALTLRATEGLDARFRGHDGGAAAVAPDPASGVIPAKAGIQSFDLLDPDGAPLLQGQVGQPARADTAHGPVAIFVRELVGPPGTEFRVVRRHRASAIQDVYDVLRVAERGKQSGIVSITYEDTDAARATAVINAIAQAYLQQNVERRSAEAEQTLAFLEQQLPKIKEKVETAEAALNRYRLEQGSADLTKETELILTQSVALEGQRVELLQKREELLQRFTPQHPTVQALDAQLRQIEGEQGAIAGRVKGLPETQQDLLRLARDVQVNSEIYTALLNNAQELQVAKAGTVGNVRIIDYALRPTEPDKPRKGLVLALSVVLGLFLGVLAIFVRRALHHGVEDPAATENQLGLPTYATVPYTRTQRKLLGKRGAGAAMRVLAQLEPNDVAVEALRSLRTSLHFAVMEARNNVIALTGPAPGIGKSFLAVNLAAVLAAGGKRVVVVDGDLRKGHLHDYLGLAARPGLSDHIAGDAELGQVLLATSIERLSFVPNGTVPPNPAELLMHPRFAEFLETLGKRFDHVLVDTPPVLAVTDATLIGRLAGTTLLVLQAGEHPMRAIEESARRLRQGGVELRGTIFNQVGLGGMGHRYGYGYGYGGKYQSAYGTNKR